LNRNQSQAYETISSFTFPQQLPGVSVCVTRTLPYALKLPHKS